MSLVADEEFDEQFLEEDWQSKASSVMKKNVSDLLKKFDAALLGEEAVVQGVPNARQLRYHSAPFLQGQPAQPGVAPVLSDEELLLIMR